MDLYSSDDIESPLDARQFSNFHSQVPYDYYRPWGYAILIRNHVSDLDGCSTYRSLSR